MPKIKDKTKKGSTKLGTTKTTTIPAAAEKKVTPLKEKAKPAVKVAPGMAPPEEFQSWTMSGTEGTKEYEVLVRTPHCGRLGVRDLGGSEYRVRVEPVDQGAAEILKERFKQTDDWKQPGDDGQFRFSKVTDSDGLQEEVSFALEALGITAEASASGLLEINPNLPDWAKQLLAGTFGKDEEETETDEDETEDADDPNAGLDADGRAPEVVDVDNPASAPETDGQGGKNKEPNGC